MGLGERMVTCFRIHWNGFFYLFSPLMLLPLAFMTPLKEYRAVFLISWVFLWYVIEVLPVGVTGLIPIVLLPILGVLSSSDTCMAYTDDPQITMLLTVFVGVAIESCNLGKRHAYSLLGRITLDPKKVLILLMSIAFFLATFLPAAFVSALMFPITRQTLVILNDISVCKDIDENAELKDDELPYPSKAACGIYIGVAYAIDIGSLSTVVSQDAGITLRNLMANDTCSVRLDSLKDNLQMKYYLISYVLALLLFCFTMIYLLFIFMGLWRKDSPAAQQITYDKDASKSALDAARGDLPPYTSHMIMTALLYYLSLVGVLVVALSSLHINDKLIGFSANAMLLALLYFIIPQNCDFCNYFKCSKPSEYLTIPSLLTWTLANKMTPWRYVWAFGSTAAIGLTIKDAKLHMFLGDNIIVMKNFMLQQLGVISMTTLMTQIASNKYVTEVMIRLSDKIDLQNNSAAAIFYPVIWCSNLTFLLPVSSVANSFASGWGNLRAKDMILASIGPLLVGFLLAFIFSIAMNFIGYYEYK